MRLLRLTPLLMLAGALASPVVARGASDFEPPDPDGVSAVIARAGHAYLVTAPQGWVLDGDAGRGDGLDAVLYPAGSTWAGAPAIMYALGVPTEDAGEIDRFIAANLSQARHRSPGLSVAQPRDLALGDGRRAPVRALAGDARGNLELVAFIGEPDAVVMLVLTSRDRSQFARCRAAFESLVASYRPVAVAEPQR